MGAPFSANPSPTLIPSLTRNLTSHPTPLAAPKPRPLPPESPSWTPDSHRMPLSHRNVQVKRAQPNRTTLTLTANNE